MSAKQYLYIVQASQENTRCKIGISDDFERRLKDYDKATGKSLDNKFRYLFVCKMKDAAQVENDIKAEFSSLREKKNREIYFYNKVLFNDYIAFIKSHKLFIEEIFVEPEDVIQEIKIIKKETPSLTERGIKKINVMHKAKKIKNDEFYTRYEDVEKEIIMYDKNIWQDKCVFCNCDDAVDDEKDERRSSAFALYFIKNFKDLNLKKLICTHYSGGIDLFYQGSAGYIFTKDGFEEINEEKEFPKNYSGSFDDPLSLQILKDEADIVCTNPPFSKIIDYWKILLESGKQFLIISNVTIAISTAFIPYFRNNKVWAGYNEVDEFLNYKREIARAAGYWFTNIPIKDRLKYKQLKIMPLKKIPNKCKWYDDNKMLVVNNNYIPSDYKKPFAVSTRPVLNGILEKGYKIISDKQYDPVLKGEINFKRVLIQKI